MSTWTIFITGLFAGGLTCIAVQGGLLASSIAQQESDKLVEKANNTTLVPILAFLLSRLFAYTLLGAGLGSLGAAFQLSLETRIWLQVAVAIFMIGTALNLLHVHPIFRYFVIQPPRFLTKLVKNQSRSKAFFGPALLGALTVFIPCGATQAMMAYAIATGSPLLGALTMFVFILGTSPLFFIFGYTAKKLSGSMSKIFDTIAAIAIILIALYNLNGAFSLAGGGIGLTQDMLSLTSPAVSEATIYLTPQGYTTQPQNLTIKAGSQVKLQLINQGAGGCIQAFTIPSLGIQKVIPLNSSTSFTFTAPTQQGALPFMCSMGMFRGIINVI